MAGLIWLGICALGAVLGLGAVVIVAVVAMSVAGLLLELFFRLLIALAGAVHWIVMGLCRLLSWPFRCIYRKVTRHAKA